MGNHPTAQSSGKSQPNVYHEEEISDGANATVNVPPTTGVVKNKPEYDRAVTNTAAVYDHSDKRRELVVAVHTYKAATPSDVSFSKGDLFVVVDSSNPEWWLVENFRTKDKGFIPSSFVAQQQTLDCEEWYFGCLSRKDAEKHLLQPSNSIGTYLIRKSERIPGHYALSMKAWDMEQKEHVKHYQIKADEFGEFYLRSGETFQSLGDLLDFFVFTVDDSGLCNKLTRPCPKQKPHLWDLSATTKDCWEIDRQTITLNRKVGEGSFGQVWLGKWNGTTDIAVKSLQEGTMSSQDFLKEAKIMKQFRHDKIVSLYAVCSRDEPIYIITEYMAKGSLKDYLQTMEGKSLYLGHLVDFGTQVASGMKYLEERQCIHRDLAARNILVGDQHVAKIADFGLARAIGNNAIYAAKADCMFPIRWTAPEALRTGQFTVKTDVWSFGIVLMEIVTYGGEPYKGMPLGLVQQQVAQGYRQPKPHHYECPDDLYNIMLHCWKTNPEQRPNFEHLYFKLDEFVVNRSQYEHNLRRLIR